MLIFFLVDQDVGIFQGSDHFFGIGHKIGGEIAAVELHAFDHFQGGFHALGFFDGDDAFFADLVHGLGDDVADGFIVVGGNGADLGDFALVLGRFAHFVQLFDGDFHGFVDAAFDGHGVVAGGNQFLAFFVDGPGQNGGRGGAVAGHVAGFAGHFFDHLGAHVFELVFQFDLFGHGDTVFGDGRGSPGFVDNDVAALGAEGYHDCIGKRFDAVEHRFAGFHIIFNYFQPSCSYPPYLR